VLRGIPTSLSSSYSQPGSVLRDASAGIVPSFWSSGVVRIATGGLDFDIRRSGVPRTALAGLLLDVGPSGRRSAALTSFIPALLHSGLLGLLGQPSHRLSELCGLCL
jgi:hypothetical protein